MDSFLLELAMLTTRSSTLSHIITMYITSLLPLIGLASALPSLVPRQNTTIDYGYWDAIYTSEGFAAGSTESVTATYSNPGHEANITVSCRSTEYHGQTTRTCDPGFSYTWGAPYG